MDKESILSNKEQLFCSLFSQTRNGRESAVRAGYSLFAEKTAEKLLNKPEIKQEIERRDKERLTTLSEVSAGLKRLAFGSVTDAVKLLYLTDDITEEELEKLDLFNVSDIKRPKGGGMEIKFFDRQKALEKLCQISNEQTAQSALPFFEALEKSAASIEVSEDEDLE